jgi:hypothetical protein
MKKIYTLLALLFMIVARASASPDTANLAIIHSVHTNDTVFIDSPTAPNFYVTYKFTNLGPDTLATTDTLFMNTPYAAYYFLLTTVGGIGVGDTITFNDTVNFVSGPANGTIPWCDSIWAKHPNNTVIFDPNLQNNKTCNNVVVHHITHTGISEKLTVGAKYRGQPMLSLYPNPANSNINFDYEFPAYDVKATVYVMDLAGRVVAQQELGSMHGTQTVNVNVNSLSTGTYIVEMRANNIRSIGRVTIQK